MSLMHPAISRSVCSMSYIAVSKSALREVLVGVTYQAHESVGVGLLLLASAAGWLLALGAELLAHSSAVVIHFDPRDNIYDTGL